MAGESLERIYLDTSVFGFFDDPLEQNQGRRESVRLLFTQISEGIFYAVCSDITTTELSKGPSATDQIGLIESRGIHVVRLKADEVANLAQKYIEQKIISPSHKMDAQHVAAATVLRVDVLVSLNLRHIVKTWRERQFNEVNSKLGYPHIRIATPEEVVRYSD